MAINKNGPTRVLFSGHDFKFLKPFIDHIRQKPAYEVRIELHRGHNINSEDESRPNLEWADVIFCEWSLGNAVWCSKNKRPGQVLIVRLHSQEIMARERIPFIYQTDWDKVDHLIAICPRHHDFMIAEFPALRDHTALIYNPIDAKVTYNRNKMPGAEFNLGLVGIVPQMKRLDLAVEILKLLKPVDCRFTLYIKGQRPEDIPWMRSRTEELGWYERLYRQIEECALGDSVLYDPHGTNMPIWYSKIGFILSVSDFEGSHQAVAEGMAAGCVPVIRAWEGADRLYPARYVVQTMPDAAAAVLELAQPDRFPNEMDFCRINAQKTFDQRTICEQMERLFAARRPPAKPQDKYLQLA